MYLSRPVVAGGFLGIFTENPAILSFVPQGGVHFHALSGIRKVLKFVPGSISEPQPTYNTPYTPRDLAPVRRVALLASGGEGSRSLAAEAQLRNDPGTAGHCSAVGNLSISTDGPPPSPLPQYKVLPARLKGALRMAWHIYGEA